MPVSDSCRDCLARQLALDYCVTEADVLDGRNHFSVYVPQEGRRRFQEKREMKLKIASVNGKLLFTGREDVISFLRGIYPDTSGNWFFEYRQLRELEEKLRPFGVRPDTAHPFFLPEKRTPVSVGDTQIRTYGKDEIGPFRGDDAFDEAFAFDPDAPDMLGIAAVRDGQILGMAGASADSPLMWQIGINVIPSARRAGIATLLVSLMREAVFDHGALPFYGASSSHMLSQRVAFRAGFLPAWAELSTK